MDRLRVIAAWIASLIYWVVGGTAFLVVGFLLPRLFRPERARELGQGALRVTFRGFVKLLTGFGIVECTYVGFERLKAETGRLILAPNHPALWDAVFVLAEVDHAACVLKASLMRNPILLGGATAAGFIPNQPVHKMLRQCIQRLRENGRVLFFPEGTRTRWEAGCLNEFTGGLAVIAKNSAAPVWPIFVQTDSPYLRKGWALWRLPPAKVHLRMTLGSPVTYQEFGDPQSFLAGLRQKYVSFL
ncbi:MAG TPA: lysophospholipid acyltransferase family protein, partial [Prosthecobacter sp.]|nr:lysophospholipid acyltransferase family protein [Prosthecobacter sp.]